MFTTVKALRGREGATRTKWQNQGWEFVNQTQGTLRSELTFRKVKPKGFGAYLAQGYAAFRGLEPKTQKTLLGGVGGLVVLLIMVGIVAAMVGGGDDAPEATQPAAVESENPPETAEPSTESAEDPTTEPAAPEAPEAQPYSYEGPKYEIVTVDADQGPAKLSQYWIHTAPEFDFTSDAYKEQVKLIVADIAHEQGTAKFLAEVVTNKEIAQAESPSTYEDFIAEHGEDYAINTIPELEVQGWVASYSGGIDHDAGEPSDEDSAFEIVWRPYATAEFEKWRPDVPTSPEVAKEGAESAAPKPKPNALQERTAIEFLAKAWEARFTYGGDVNDLMGLLDVVKNSDGSYYIEVTADVENEFGNEFEAVIKGTVGGTDSSPKIRKSTLTTPDGGTINYFG